MAGRAGAGSGFTMPGLIVKKEIRLEFGEKRAFIQPAEKHSLIDRDAPLQT